MIVKWKAFFSGGRIFDNTTEWPNLPNTGALIFMLTFEDGTRRVMHGNDRYFWQNNGSIDGIFACTDDPAAEIIVRYPGAIIIEGELVIDTEMNAAMETAFRIKS